MNMKSVNMVKPRSAWVSFPTLMLTLSRFLDPRKMSLIHKWHEDFIVSDAHVLIYLIY